MSQQSSRRWASLMPLIIFLTLILALGANVLWKQHGPTGQNGSRLVGKSLPGAALTALTRLQTDEPALPLPTGKAYVVNIFASWCTPCITEVPELDNIRRQGHAVIGLAWKDSTETLQQWLTNVGNPYSDVYLLDKPELVMQLGLTGVPETLVVKDDVILWHFAGPLKTEQVEALQAVLR